MTVINGTLADVKLAEPVDFLLIDGAPFQTRAEWMERAPNFVRPGGIVCIDNVDKEMHKEARQRLWEYAVRGMTITANPKRVRNYVTDFLRMPGGEDEWI